MKEKKVPNSEKFIFHHIRAIVLREVDEIFKGDHAQDLAQHSSKKITEERYLAKVFDVRKLMPEIDEEF